VKKNVIFIVLDSFIYDKIGTQSYGTTTSPFLDELKKKSLYTTNLYSSGPYTEAAIMSLFSGNDSLNEGGYMHNLNTKKNHYIDVFHENGYELFSVFYPFFMYSDDTLSKIDHQIFNCDFIFGSVYNNRLDYYRKLEKTKDLTEDDYRNIFYQLDITFSAWRNFLEHSDKNKEKYSIINKALIDYDFEKNKVALLNEYNKYIENKKIYVHTIFNEQSEHALFKIDRMDPGNLASSSLIDKLLYKKSKWFLIKVSLMQFCYNLANNKILYKRFFRSLIENIKKKKLHGYIKSITFSLFAGGLNYKYKKKNFLKEMPSFYTQIEYSLKVIKKRNQAKPFILTLHPQDLHHRTSYLTYDSNSETILMEDIERLKKYFKEIKGNFKGSLIYDFSVVYIDLCIKRLFSQLSEMKLMGNTVVVITSDHGCSYVNAPIRDLFVNNPHTENYKIPLFIYDGEISKKYDSYYTSKDVLPTIYDLCEIESPTNISGHSILDNNYVPDCAISEYMGGGCPDMKLRPIQYIIRNNSYLLVYSVKLDEVFNNGKLIEIYDLQKDSKEEKNLINSEYDFEQVNYLLNRVKKRHIELQSHYSVIL
jgi:arylsulfatase A-like enzyme